MAESRDLLFRFLGDAKDLAGASRKAKTSLKDVDDGAKKTGGGLRGMAASGKAVVGGFVALAGTAVVGFLKNATQAALEDNAAQVQLAHALQNTVGATDEQVAAAEEYIDATARATGITDNELRPALAELTRSTGDVTKAQELMGTAMDIATAKGIPLETVVKALGKGAQGNVAAMGRMNLKVRDSEGAFLTFDEAVAEANKTMGGATKAAAGSAEGAFRRMQVATDEAKESIGNALLPALADAADIASDAATVFGFLTEKITGAATAANVAATGSDSWYESLVGLVPWIRIAIDEVQFLADEIRDSSDAAQGTDRPYKTAKTGLDHLSDSTNTATEALQEFEDETRSQIDPMFNLVDAVNDLDKAQQNTADALLEYGEGSAEHREALRKEAEAWLEVKEAQVRAATESGITREAFRKNLEQMGVFTAKEIDLMLEDFDRVNNYTFKDKVVNLRVAAGNLIDDTRIGRRQAGGPVHAGQSYVVGERGPEMLTMGSTGGHVTAHHRTNGGVGPQGSPVNVTVNGFVGSASQLANEIDRILTLRNRRNTLGFLRPGEQR